MWGGAVMGQDMTGIPCSFSLNWTVRQWDLWDAAKGWKGEQVRSSTC